MSGLTAASKPSRVFSDSVLFAGGRLCVDFVNTACERRGTPLEFLGDLESLNDWLRSAERIHGRQFTGGSGWHADDEDKSLVRALELRGALWDLIESVLEKRAPLAPSVKTLNGVLRANPTYLQVESESDGYRHSVNSARHQDAWLMEIARDAVDLLCHSDLSLLRQCECESCVRVFYDTTKNHKRRWCVEKCGSRVKAARYYKRKREARSGDSPFGDQRLKTDQR